MDVQTIDQQYSQLQQQAQSTVQALQTLGNKLQAAAGSGDSQAREWMLDLRELALSFRAEQDSVRSLLQAMHNYVANEAQAQPQYQPQPQQTGWSQPQPQPGYAPPQPVQQQGGGMFGGFLNSGVGRALEMGAGFGIAEDVVRDLF